MMQGNFPYGVKYLVCLLVCSGWMQGPSYPARFLAQVAMIDLFRNLLALIVTYLQEKMTIGSSTGASSPGLYAEPVVKKLHKEVKMNTGVVNSTIKKDDNIASVNSISNVSIP